jgi:hypothetical protein
VTRPVSRLFGAAGFAAAIVIVVVGRASTPAGRYTIANGTVYDTKTKLTWQQAIPSSTYTQAGAASYCSTLGLNGATWRLPTAKELLSIVDISVGAPGPTIDSSAFPSTPANFFWSSTPYAGTSGSAWYVGFDDGGTGYGVVSNTDSVRCVR